MQALTGNNGTRSLASGYCFSKCGEFAFEAAFAVAMVSMTCLLYTSDAADE